MSFASESNGQSPLSVKRLPVTFASDNRRVITRFFDPGSQNRIRNVVRRVSELSDEDVGRLLEEVFQRFHTRHKSLPSVLEQHYKNAMTLIG
jgi:hypothetical protein